jgi:hypothetical protein
MDPTVGSRWSFVTRAHLPRALHLASPFLQLLTLQLNMTTADQPVLSMAFPLLKSLTLDQSLPIMSAPRLEALHVILSNDRPTDDPHLLVDLRSQAPPMQSITIIDHYPRLLLGAFMKLISNIEHDTRTATPGV